MSDQFKNPNPNIPPDILAMMPTGKDAPPSHEPIPGAEHYRGIPLGGDPFGAVIRRPMPPARTRAAVPLPSSMMMPLGAAERQKAKPPTCEGRGL